MNLIMVCGMFVYSLCTSVCMFTVSNALLMSTAIVIVRSVFFLLKPVVIVLFLLCSAVLVEWLPLKPFLWRCVGCCL